MKFETKYLIPILVLLVVLVIKNMKSNRLNNSKNVENFQNNNNVMPTTIDYRTISIKQGNNDGSYLLLGKFPSTKTNLSFYLDMLPNEHFNGRTQYGFSFSNDTKSCYHELIFGIPSFSNLMVILRESEWYIILKKVAPQENTKYKVAMPCILTTSGDLNTSEFLNINSEGESSLDTFVPTDEELKDKKTIISSQNTDRTKALVNNTIKDYGLELKKFGDQEILILNKHLFALNGLHATDVDIKSDNGKGNGNLTVNGNLRVLGGGQIDNKFHFNNGLTANETSVINSIKTNHIHSNGQIYANDLINCKGVIFDRERPHINVDGALYRHGGQVYLTHDDNLYIRNYRGKTFNLKDTVNFNDSINLSAVYNNNNIVGGINLSTRSHNGWNQYEYKVHKHKAGR